MRKSEVFSDLLLFSGLRFFAELSVLFSMLFLGFLWFLGGSLGCFLSVSLLFIDFLVVLAISASVLSRLWQISWDVNRFYLILPFLRGFRAVSWRRSRVFSDLLLFSGLRFFPKLSVLFSMLFLGFRKFLGGSLGCFFCFVIVYWFSSGSCYLCFSFK